ncbi:MAG: hypothetical protein M3Y85_11620 [Bacteroidota bacterium]|nr:hypothetical protein [Bacteroidota bacterium]
MAFLFAAMTTFEAMKKWLFVIALWSSTIASGQIKFSLVTGVSVLRNFSPQQKFWAIGQTVQGDFHFTAKESAYASLDFYGEGKFRNNFIATAKSTIISPQQLSYTATGHMLGRHISLGWKHYFTGSFKEERATAIYGQAGFGFLFAKLRNSFTIAVDTTLYNARPKEGESKIRKLSFDLGIGAEQPLGGNFYGFAEVNTWLPASSNTSPYLHNQRNVPLPVILSVGVRLLFDFGY